ncbi:MAG: hypothetical protein KAR20_27935 [Candidatus Heimdallarchaeota archaeon]|nr:hypothetical protein [Candidatus Heimdallarchaeota archaeon]
MNEQPPHANQQTKARNPYTIWFVIFAFVAPVVLAYIMFYFMSVQSFSNHGEIYSPVVDITELKLTDINGDSIPEHALLNAEVIEGNTLRYKWRFYSIVDNECDDACKKRLIDSRQLHRSFGKDSHRIMRVIVYLESPDEALSQFIKSEIPEAAVMYGSSETIKNALKITVDKNEIFVSDPMGNIMMRFRENQPLKDFKSDMKKLLKASQIG